MLVPWLAYKSLANRKVMAALTVLTIAVSTVLLLGVDKIRTAAKESFVGTVSGTDLIIGARTGEVQLLLYSVFHIGNATNNFSWRTYQDIAARPEVAWMVPIALGDSHRGFRVVGTSAEFFQRYRFRDDQKLTFSSGKPFADLFDAVVGAHVAAQLGYRVGDSLVVSHGVASIGAAEHDDKPFALAGILAKTGTPLDRSVLISMEAIEAIHVDWTGGTRARGAALPAEAAHQLDLTPTQATAALVGLKSRLSILGLQRFVNEYRGEPMTAVIPGVALLELWDIVGTVEIALLAVSAMVVVTAVVGMVISILSTLNERRREMAVLRATGARPVHIFALLTAEAGFLSLAGVLLGMVALYGLLYVLQPLIDRRFGLYIPIDPPGLGELATLAAIAAAGMLAGAYPAVQAYRTSLGDGIAIRT